MVQTAHVLDDATRAGAKGDPAEHKGSQALVTSEVWGCSSTVERKGKPGARGPTKKRQNFKGSWLDGIFAVEFEFTVS